MKNVINLIITLVLLSPVSSYAEEPIVFSSVSAGVFRFQIKLAEQGNPEAQYKVGEMYEMGNGVEKDIESAQQWYEKSAKQGHHKAEYKLLYIEINSNGLNDFTKTQLGVLRQEAAGGNADAQYFLGKMYATGTGVPKSLNNALTWLNKATFNGIPEAEHEAIAVEEELVRIREREARKRATALEAANKKKEEEAKQAALKKKQKEKKRIAEIAKRKSQKDTSAQRLKEERKKLQQEKAALSAQIAKNEKQRRANAAAEKRVQAAQAAKQQQKEASTDASSFEADPCKGKSARFLSTCR